MKNFTTLPRDFGEEVLSHSTFRLMHLLSYLEDGETIGRKVMIGRSGMERRTVARAIETLIKMRYLREIKSDKGPKMYEFAIYKFNV